MSTLTLEEAYDKWADDLVRFATVVTGPDDAVDAVAETFGRLLAADDANWLAARDPRA